MTATGVIKTDLISWIEKSVENEGFSDYDISFTGKSEKGDGYVGDIVFAKVKSISTKNSKKELDLVIKHGKSNDYLRKVSPVRSAFETEIHFYKDVLPEFKKFQLQHNVHNIFSSVPKCYNTLILDNMEVLVMENLKKAGYELHDKFKPLNLNHLKKVLKEYGKFHALSFALKDQQPERFASLTANQTDVLLGFVRDKSIREVNKKATDEFQNMLQERNEITLLEKFRKLLTRHPSDIYMDLILEEKSQLVIAHGDCWNNNFMFQYQGGDRTTPTKVAFLDFQLSYLRSPVYDLTYFLYSTCGKEQLDKFEELMETYYSSLSSFLTELGSDPEELFPYSALKTHWRKYSRFGVIFMLAMLKFALCSKEDAPSMEDLREGEAMGTFVEINIGIHKDLYYDRVKAVLCHHLECTF